MPRSIKLSVLASAFHGLWKDPKKTVRVLIGALLVANLAAAWQVYRPWGGSSEDLERQMTGLRTQLQQHQQALDRSRALLAKVAKGRTAGDQFMNQYFLDRRTEYSSIVADLTAMAKQAQIKERGESYKTEPIEGSDSLGMLTITYNCEGTYADLVQFLQRLDQSSHLVIIDSLRATPQQQSGGVLGITLRLETFIRNMNEPEFTAEEVNSSQ